MPGVVEVDEPNHEKPHGMKNTTWKTRNAKRETGKKTRNVTETAVN